MRKTTWESYKVDLLENVEIMVSGLGILKHIEPNGDGYCPEAPFILEGIYEYSKGFRYIVKILQPWFDIEYFTTDLGPIPNLTDLLELGELEQPKGGPLDIWQTPNIALMNRASSNILLLNTLIEVLDGHRYNKHAWQQTCQRIIEVLRDLDKNLADLYVNIK